MATPLPFLLIEDEVYLSKVWSATRSISSGSRPGTLWTKAAGSGLELELMAWSRYILLGFGYGMRMSFFRRYGASEEWRAAIANGVNWREREFSAVGKLTRGRAMNWERVCFLASGPICETGLPWRELTFFQKLPFFHLYCFAPLPLLQKPFLFPALQTKPVISHFIAKPFIFSFHSAFLFFWNNVS